MLGSGGARMILHTSRKTIEIRPPAPGQRHNTETLYVPHRFPVVGGISWDEYLAITYARPSRLRAALEVRR